MPREIPDSIKRAVRQRCGFGCIFDGAPIYHYDHMVEYSLEKGHREENITLLCPSHHDEKSRGRLPLSRVQAANLAPCNKRSASTAPYHLHYGTGGSPEIHMAQNSWASAGAFCALMIDEIPIVMVRQDPETREALFSANILDRYNELALRIVDNELTLAADLWDVEFVGTRITLRSRSGEVFLRLNFRVAENILDVERGQILCNGARVVLDGEGLLIGDLARPFSVRQCHFDAPVGIAIGRISPGLAAAFQIGVDRYENWRGE